MPTCNRCGSKLDPTVSLFEECKICGPVMLCDDCKTKHREEIKNGEL